MTKVDNYFLALDKLKHVKRESYVSYDVIYVNKEDEVSRATLLTHEKYWEAIHNIIRNGGTVLRTAKTTGSSQTEYFTPELTKLKP